MSSTAIDCVPAADVVDALTSFHALMTDQSVANEADAAPEQSTDAYETSWSLAIVATWPGIWM